MFIICALQVLINSQYVNNRHANKPLIVRTGPYRQQCSPKNSKSMKMTKFFTFNISAQ